jgi:homogentisate 1,2-dioxygenase
MTPARPDMPVNLTLLANRLRLLDGSDRSGRVLRRANLVIDVWRVDARDEGDETLATHDEIHIVVAGYGLFRCGDHEAMEFTEGDVLLVPAGAAYRIERKSPRVMGWKIVSLATR